VGHNLLLAACLEHSQNELLALIELLAELSSVGLWPAWELEVLAGLTVLVHEGQEVLVVDVNKGVLSAGDNWYGGTVGGWNHILKLLVVEDVGSSEVALCVSVLSGLGSGYINNLAWLTLDHDKTTLADLTSLHRNGFGSSCLTLGEIIIFYSCHLKREKNNDNKKL
jgi:hypothetical protein